jgi:hypothetical protein
LGIKASSTPISSTTSDRRADLTVTLPLMGNRRVTNCRQSCNAFYGYVTDNILLDRNMVREYGLGSSGSEQSRARAVVKANLPIL